VLIERHQQTNTTLCNMLGEITLEDGARLTHVRLQTCGNTVTHLDTRSVRIGRNASYSHYALIQGAGLSRYEPHISLCGAGAVANLTALLLLEGHQQGDLTSNIIHAEPQGNSNQSVRAVLTGTARGTYQGRIAVAPYAKLSDAQQLSRALLLSPTAEMNAKPELEILNDDVKCSHGASMGALDETALFYLRSRGLSDKAARALLVDAFVASGLAGLPEALQPMVNGEVAKWLEAQHG